MLDFLRITNRLSKLSWTYKRASSGHQSSYPLSRLIAGVSASNPPKNATDDQFATKQAADLTVLTRIVAKTGSENANCASVLDTPITSKSAVVTPPQAVPPTMQAADPNVALRQLLAMIKPRPPVPMAGTGQPAARKPGGEFGGRNTPTLNPIGLLSGLGVDPGGRSVMGNAAFGTKNNLG